MNSARYWTSNRYADNTLDTVPKIEILANYPNFGRIVNVALCWYYQTKFKKCLDHNNHYVKSSYESSLVINGNIWELKQMNEKFTCPQLSYYPLISHWALGSFHNHSASGNRMFGTTSSKL